MKHPKNYDQLFVGMRLCNFCWEDKSILEFRIIKKKYKNSCYLGRRRQCTVCEKIYLSKYLKHD